MADNTKTTNEYDMSYKNSRKDALKLYRKLFGLQRVSANHSNGVEEIQLALCAAFW